MQSVIENSRDLRLTLHGVTTILSCAFKRREEKEGDKVGKEEAPDSTWLSFLLLLFVPILVIFRERTCAFFFMCKTRNGNENKNTSARNT